jgi:hypothetical protein
MPWLIAPSAVSLSRRLYKDNPEAFEVSEHIK